VVVFLILYTIFFIFIALLYCVGNKFFSPLGKYFKFFSFLGFWLLAGLRGSVGQDTYSYISHFNSIDVSNNFYDYFFRVEPFFALIMIVSKLLSNDVIFFF
jgi:hypothetical protein